MSADFRSKYFTGTESGFPDEVCILGVSYVKVEDLRYGTNPHQPASFYKPKDSGALTFGDMRILKSGKSGLSETNYGDLNHGANIVKYFDEPACALMKHLNPSGAIAEAGIKAIVQPGRSVKDWESIEACNQHGISMVFTGERIFSHH